MSNTSAETPEEGKHTPEPWYITKCNCGHPSCDKYFINVTGSDGRLSKADAELIARAPSLERENAELKKRVAELEAEVTRLGVIIQQIDSENHNLRQKIKLLQELKNEIGLYLRRMAEQEATIRELCDTKSGQAETIKRYKALIEEHIELDGWIYQKTFEHDMPGATPLHDWIIRAKSALEGTNE